MKKVFPWKWIYFDRQVGSLILQNKDGCNVSQLVVAWLFCELQWSINDIYAYVTYIFSNSYFEH